MKINLIRGDRGLWVNPAPPYLLNYLQYTKRSFGKKNWEKVDEFTKYSLYSLDGTGGIFTLHGYYEKLIKLIKKNLDVPIIDDRRTRLPEIDWNAVKRMSLRDYQITPILEFLPKAQETSGMFLGCGGFGKSRMIASTYAAWNTLNTIVTVPYSEVVEQLYNTITELFPDKHVGMVGGGMHDISSDITICTFASLKNCALEKCQMLLVDELQGAAGDKIQEIIGSITPIRTFGYTATNTGLFSRADKVLVGFFGEALVDISYQDAIKMGAVVPCTVYMVKMPGHHLPLGGNTEQKLKNGIMKHVVRNNLIGDISKAVPNQWQTLIFIDQIKNHLMNLATFLPPEIRYVHRNSDKEKVKEFALSKKQQKKNIVDFVNNEYQYLCSSDVLRAGFDSQNCRVVIQAAGGSSSIEVLQEALRGSRILPEARRIELGVTPKTHFVLVDVMDTHDDTLLNMSNKRIDHYESQGWPVHIVDKISDIDWNRYDH